MLFVYFSTLLESILKSGLLLSALLAGENWVGIVGVGIVGVGIIAPTRKFWQSTFRLSPETCPPTPPEQSEYTLKNALG